MVSFGQRATVYPGAAPLPEIFLAEISGKDIKKSQVEGKEMGEKALDKWESEKPGSELEALEYGNPERTARTGKMLVTGRPHQLLFVPLRELIIGKYLPPRKYGISCAALCEDICKMG
jgi:hypothetical protein